MLSHFSHAQPDGTPWTVAHQTPLSMRFSKQEYWSGLPFPSPGDLPNPQIEPRSPKSPVLASEYLPLGPPERPRMHTLGPKSLGCEEAQAAKKMLTWRDPQGKTLHPSVSSHDWPGGPSSTVNHQLSRKPSIPSGATPTNVLQSRSKPALLSLGQKIHKQN